MTGHNDDARKILHQLGKQADWHESQSTAWEPDEIREFIDAWAPYLHSRSSAWARLSESNAGAVLGIVCGLAIVGFWSVVFWKNPDFFPLFAG